ncbi:MAG: HEAT repeat domain-containing protein, partial [Desulfocapsaceae bacterium]|nr:HEAT repeat domain-containing protein [Desulfocapsaceae bacterium]
MTTDQPTEIDENVLGVIKDFLEMGHVDNIVAMFHRNHEYYQYTGPILDDERFNVRLGVSVLFEELRKREPEELDRAVPSLLPLLESEKPHIRGEALSVLGIIGSKAAFEAIKTMLHDRQPQISEIASDILAELGYR